MSVRLSPCPSCTRHVRISESICPFCAATMPERAAADDAALPVARLSRGAVYALGAARAKGLAVAGAAIAAATLGGCAAYGSPPHDGGPGADMSVDLGSFDAMYGSPDLGVDAGVDFGGIDAAYGGPPDMGVPTDMGVDGPVAAYGSPPDLGNDSGGGIGPAYGVPPDASGV